MRDHPIQVLDQYVMVLPGPNRDCHCSVLPQESINISNSDHPHVCIQSLKGGRTTVQCELLFTGDTMDELGGGGVTFSRAGMEMGRPCRARGTRLLEVKGLDPSQGHKKEGNKADCTWTEAPSPQHMLHCSSGLQLQNVDLKIKLLRILRWLSQSIKTISRRLFWAWGSMNCPGLMPVSVSTYIILSFLYNATQNVSERLETV